jgi:3',5'-cyclic AMP phosphodiesterase CpdA
MTKIALIGDLHYPTLASEIGDVELISARDKFYAKFLAAFLAEEADCHVCIGDLSHMGLAEEFVGFRKALDEQVPVGRQSGAEVRFRAVLGNHDVLALPKREISALMEQPLYEMVETDDALLIFLDTTRGFELHGWGVDEAQWRWLEERIGYAPEKAMAIFAHHPVPGTTGDSPSADGSFAPFQDLRPLLARRSGLALYCNGHTHTHSIASAGGWRFVQTAAAYCHPCYRMIEIVDGVANVRTVAIRDEEVNEYAKFLYDKLTKFHKPKRPSFAPEDLEGRFMEGDLGK